MRTITIDYVPDSAIRMGWYLIPHACDWIPSTFDPYDPSPTTWRYDNETIEMKMEYWRSADWRIDVKIFTGKCQVCGQDYQSWVWRNWTVEDVMIWAWKNE